MRRRAPTPGPGRDWRAIAAPLALRGLALPVHVAGEHDTAGALKDNGGGIDLRLQREGDGRRFALVASVVWRSGDDVRRFAERLQAAADALDGGAS